MGKIIVQVDSEIRELIPEFIRNRQGEIEILRRLTFRRDFQSIKILGHSMKGYAAGYGFHEMSDIGEALERYAIQRDVDEIAYLTDRLVEYLQQIEIVYV